MIKFFISRKTFNEFMSGDNPLIEYTNETQKITRQNFVRFTKRGRKLIEAGNWYKFIDGEKEKPKPRISPRAISDSI
ncbi:MAG TPA: hypothetical protein VN026_18820 [Bacteroidia bacterium]|nr:hypothetical protein [Bacteroidia bacterium]